MKLRELLGLSHPPLVGVDICCSGINVVEIDRNSNRSTVNAIARAPLRPEDFSGYLIKDPDRVGGALSDLLRRHNIATERVAVALPSPAVFQKVISVPRAPRHELAELVRMEAASVIPHRMDAVKFDYHVLRAAPRNQLRLLLMAAKCDVVENRLRTLTAAGLNTVVIDVDTCAIQNSFERYSGRRYLGKVVALVHLEARFTAVTISKDGEILACGDLPSSFVDGASGEEVNRLATGLWKELTELMRERGVSDSPSLIVLSGQFARNELFSANLAESSGVPCLLADPLHGFDIGAQITTAAEIERSYDLTVAFGLALREVGDKADTVFPREVSSGQ